MRASAQLEASPRCFAARRSVAARARRLRCAAVRCAVPQRPPPAPSAAQAARLAESGSLAACAALAAVGAPAPALHASLLAVEAGYAVLHAWPLAPLAQPEPQRRADTAFMATFTTPLFFASELLLFALLWAAAPAVRAAVPAVAVATHAAFHAAYTAIAAFAPGWAVEQNVRRVGSGRASPARRAWDAGLNVLNAADFGMHAWYMAALAGALPPPAAAAAVAAGGCVTVAALWRLGRSEAADAAAGADLRGKVAVVTGAAGGIGRAVAAQLAARGAFVVALARDDASAAAAAKAAADAAAAAGSGGGAEGVACDLSSVAAVTDAARAIAARHPTLHLLVCNAAVARWGGATQRTPDGHELHLGVNQLAHHCLAAQLAPCLAVGAPSRVVVVASEAARWPGAGQALAAALDGGDFAGPPWAAYSGSKLANVAWSRAAARRWGPAGVAVVALHPGIAPSGLQRHMGALGAALNALTAALGGGVYASAARVIAAASGAEPQAFALSSACDAALDERVWAAGEAALRAADEARCVGGGVK